MSREESKEFKVGLTSTEISNIWGAYEKNNLESCFLEYFYQTAEDAEIKKIVEAMLNQNQRNIKALKDIFVSENLAVPLGFTKEDVRADAPKVFSDLFILYFSYDLTLLSMNTFSSIFCDCSRKDIRRHFQLNIDFFANTQNEIVELMQSKGVYLRPPQLAIDNIVDFVDEKKYLSGLFGGSRPLNAAEVANLSRIIHRAQFSKMVFVSFSKLAASKDIEKHFSNGRDEIQKVLNTLQKVLENENISISASSDYNLLDIKVSPFSDRLMLYFVNACLGLLCFTMLSQAMTSSFRSDIVSKISDIMSDMKLYYGKSILITINEGWLEKPPQLIDRRT